MRYYILNITPHGNDIALEKELIHTNYLGTNWDRLLNENQVGLIRYLFEEVWAYNMPYYRAQAILNKLIEDLRKET